MIPELPIQFDLPLARRLAVYSLRAYQDIGTYPSFRKFCQFRVVVVSDHVWNLDEIAGLLP
jgi:hypothetical protein